MAKFWFSKKKTEFISIYHASHLRNLRKFTFYISDIYIFSKKKSRANFIQALAFKSTCKCSRNIFLVGTSSFLSVFVYQQIKWLFLSSTHILKNFFLVCQVFNIHLYEYTHSYSFKNIHFFNVCFSKSNYLNTGLYLVRVGRGGPPRIDWDIKVPMVPDRAWIRIKDLAHLYLLCFSFL